MPLERAMMTDTAVMPASNGHRIHPMSAFAIGVALALLCSSCASPPTRYEEIHGMADPERKAESLAAFAEDMFRSEDEKDLEAAARSTVNLANLLLEQGQYGRAIEASQTGIARLERYQVPVLRSRVASLLTNQGEAWDALGDKDRQRTTLERIVSTYGQDGYPTTIAIVANARIGQIDAALLQGEPVTAEQMLTDFEETYVTLDPDLADLDRMGFLADLDGMGFRCITGTEKAVGCIPMARQDAKYFSLRFQLYKDRLCKLRPQCRWNAPGYAPPVRNPPVEASPVILPDGS